MAEDQEIDEIPHKAAEQAMHDFPRNDEGFRTRIVVVLAAILIIINTAVGIYNSLALRAEVACNHQVVAALFQVGDQNRNITKNAIDAALSGKITSLDAAQKLMKKYDDAFKANGLKRENILAVTCNNHNQNVPTSIPTSAPTS